jgi:hypothetical protein
MPKACSSSPSTQILDSVCPTAFGLSLAPFLPFGREMDTVPLHLGLTAKRLPQASVETLDFDF